MSNVQVLNNQRGNIELILLPIFIVALVGFIGWYWIAHHQPTTSASTSHASQQAVTASPPLSQTLTPNTDNSSLTSDLGNLDSSISQESQDSNSSASAINDQQIQVPTQ